MSATGPDPIPPKSQAVQAERRAGGSASAVHGALVDAAYEEFCQLRAAGANPDVSAFCARYPALRASLVRLLDAHGYLDGNIELIDVGPEGDFPGVGETFAGFRLVEMLGSGSFSRVYLATEPALGNRRVVVKVSKNYGAGEAATLGPLTHPNIVPIHSAQPAPGSGMMVVCMPYLGSATLDDVIDYLYRTPARPKHASLIAEAACDLFAQPGSHHKPAPPLLRRGTFCDGVRWFAAQLAEALGFVHERGILHRDLKPSNVVVRPDGTPMLLDFNLSWNTEQPCIRIGGTLAYMPPEQLVLTDPNRTDKTAPLDARADLYALGVMLYVMLTGKHPFSPLPLKPAELRRHLLYRQREGPTPIRQIAPDVDATLARLVENCLEFDRERRPDSATQLARSLRRDLSPLRRAGRWLWRHPKTVAAAALSLVLAGSLYGYYLSQLPPAHVVAFRRAQEALHAGDADRALDLLNQALRDNPKQPDALFQRARVFQKLGLRNPTHLATAVSDWRQLIELSPEPRYHAGLGYALYQLKEANTSAACLQFAKARARGYVTPVVLNNLAALALPNLGDFGVRPEEKLHEARACLEEALQLDLHLAAAHHNLAHTLLRQFNLKSLKAQLPEAKRELQVLLETGVRHMEQALELQSITPDLVFDAAVLCAMAARQEPERWSRDAVRHLKKALDLGFHQKMSLMTDSRFLALRQDPSFQEQARRVQAAAPFARAPRVLDPFAASKD